MAPLLEIEDLRTDIRLRAATVHALDGVSLTVEAGECLGIVGESGSGKTMTALSIMQLLPPGGRIVGGSITLGGEDIAAMDDRGMRQIRGNEIDMIFQDPMTSLNPTMTIGDQIAETVILHRGADKKTALARAVEVLGLVGMPHPAERVAILMGGEVQAEDESRGDSGHHLIAAALSYKDRLRAAEIARRLRDSHAAEEQLRRLLRQTTEMCARQLASAIA
jgi:ABC-type dipeptide/oligopeptide/nickel transport system ATPase component